MSQFAFDIPPLAFFVNPQCRVHKPPEVKNSILDVGSAVRIRRYEHMQCARAAARAPSSGSLPHNSYLDLLIGHSITVVH